MTAKGNEGSQTPWSVLPQESAIDARSLSALVHLQAELEKRISIEHSAILHHLKDVVTDHQYEYLCLESQPNHVKVQYLVDFLSAGSQQQFARFVSILRLCGHEDVANALDTHQQEGGQQRWSAAFVREVLKQGSVPSFENITLRQEKLDLIRCALRNVGSSQGHSLRVVVVHGMGGSGKTVLAAEAVRCAPLMADCFPSGVIWKSVGHMRGLEGAALERELHEFLVETLTHPQVGWKRREGQQTPSEMTLRQLNAEMTHAVAKKPILVVVDDVWQQDVLRVLDNVPFILLLTTRIRAVADSLLAPKEYIEALKCTTEEARRIVTSHGGCIDEEAMAAVLNRCDGLPLALVVLASALRGKSPQRQRETLLTPSRQLWLLRPFAGLPTQYRHFADALEVSLLQLEKEIHEETSLGQVFMVSGKELLDLYLDLAAIDDDDELVVSRLAPVWNQSEELTLRLLNVLADRALLTVAGKKHEETEEDVFTIHDVQLEFLRELVKSREEGTLNGRFKRWIEGFLKKNDHSEILGLWLEARQLDRMEELWRTTRALDCGPSDSWWQGCMTPLTKMVQYSDQMAAFQRRLVTLLLSKVSPTDQGWTILHQACFEGLTEAIPYLFQAFPVESTPQMVTTSAIRVGNRLFREGTVPLHAAAASGSKPVLESLLRESGCDPHYKDKEGWTPLMWAASNGHKDAVELLIRELGCDPHHSDNGGLTPLMWAASNGHTDVVELLLQEPGCDVNHKDNGGRTPLMLAASNGHKDAVQLLIREPGCDPQHKDNAGRSSLMWAAANGYTDVMEFLIREYGCDPQHKDNAGRTPLMWAASNGHKEVVELLVREPGCEPHQRDNGGWTPFMWAARWGHKDVVQLLIREPGCEPHHKDNGGRTPLMWASYYGHKDVVELIIREHGCDPCYKNNRGRTPLMWAARWGHKDVAKLLIREHGANPNHKDNDGSTPLMWAARWDHKDVVELLIREHGCDPHDTDNRGWTPLTLAASNGHKDLVELLIREHGCDPHHKDNDGWTPLMWAKENVHLDVVELLQQVPHAEDPT